MLRILLTVFVLVALLSGCETKCKEKVSVLAPNFLGFTEPVRCDDPRQTLVRLSDKDPIFACVCSPNSPLLQKGVGNGQ